MMKRTTSGLALCIAAMMGGQQLAHAEPAALTHRAKASMQTLDEVAARYVKLALALGKHDANYVDAYYGPEQWRKDADAMPRSLAAIDLEAAALYATVQASDPSPLDPMGKLRHTYLERQLGSMRVRIAFLGGGTISFDEEARTLYDASAPHFEDAHFAALTAELEQLLPGEGALAERFAHYQAKFTIPPARLDAVFRAAVAEGRRRSLAQLALPADESFVIEYVNNKPWSAYNWYKGGAHSLIQVNTDLPIFIERAIDLACHEGYPGHHVYNALLEQHMVRERGWVEFTVYPLFSPQSLIAEGSANYGIKVAFTDAERLAFEQRVLFPLAGLDPSTAEAYYKVLDIVGRLNYAGNEAARAYLDGKKTRQEAIDYLVRYSLSTPERAAQRLRFIDTYRSYVINYNLGQDLVGAYVKAQGGDTPEARWKIFGQLLSSPMLPSGLK
jgi:hypothetical protein